MYFFAIFLSLFCVCVNGITNYKHAIACEHKNIKLKCGDNQVLDILEANYGRTSSSICSADEPAKDVNCYQEDTLSIVSDLCEGKNSCSVKAENDVFQDPCYGIVKYLFVLYRCVDVVKYRSALACENKTVKLKCGPGNVIQIVDANYGRRSKFICGDGPIHTTHCPNTNTVKIIADICKNKRECFIQASNSVFGDPCSGTLKYLTVKYKCGPKTDETNNDQIIEDQQNLFHCVNGPSINEDLVCNGFNDCPLGDDEFVCNYKSEYACEKSKLEIKCAKDEKINIINSNYGRLSRDICPTEYMEKKIDCRENNSVNILRKKCNGKWKCDIKAENKVFSDPCYGTYKYLEAHYDCVSDDVDAHKINPRSIKY